MAAFVPGNAWVAGTAPLATSSICSRPSSFRAPRRLRHVTMMADSDSPPESPEPARPEEPYPGFFADMQRMGLSDEQANAQAAKAQKQKNPVKSEKVGGVKNLLKPDGTPYAPWMVGVSVDYDSSVIKQRTDATGKLAADPQRGELSGMGVQWKMLGDELELSWATGRENANKGFAVYRRAGKSEKWEKVSDYRDATAELASKGPDGGKYSFLVKDPQPGSWVYRVSDVNQDDNVSDLSQVLVEIDSAEDTKVQKIALAALLAVLALTAAAGIFFDPLSNTY